MCQYENWPPTLRAIGFLMAYAALPKPFGQGLRHRLSTGESGPRGPVRGSDYVTASSPLSAACLRRVSGTWGGCITAVHSRRGIRAGRRGRDACDGCVDSHCGACAPPARSIFSHSVIAACGSWRRAGRLLDADAVGFLFHFTRVRTHEGEFADATEDAAADPRIDPEIRASKAPPMAAAALTPAACPAFARPCSRKACAISCAMTAASSSSVSLQLLDQPAVNRDLATRHAPGVELARSHDIDLPVPPGASLRKAAVAGIQSTQRCAARVRPSRGSR